MCADTASAAEPTAIIVVAEDDPLIRTLITRLITTLHALPLAVADGATALAVVQATEPP